jgi:hypothetical protein
MSYGLIRASHLRTVEFVGSLALLAASIAGAVYLAASVF